MLINLLRITLISAEVYKKPYYLCIVEVDTAALLYAIDTETY